MNALNIKRTTNKIKKLAAAALAFGLFALAGCQQSADSGDMALAPAVTESAPAAVNGSYITLGFSAAGEQSAADGVSASALPDPAGIVFGKFVLSGTSAQQGIAPVTWSCGDGTADASQELADAKVPVTKNAEYTFTLTATTLGGAVYVGVTNPAVTLIDQNVKRLSFSMRFSKAAGEGSAGQKGDATVGLNLPSGGKGGEVNKITVSLYKLDQNGQKILPPVEGFDEKEVPIEDGKALFETGELDAGAYRADFSLWGGNDSRALLGSWSEDIVIAGGQTSASTLNPAGGAEGDQVDLAYSITYHKNGDETDPADVATPTSFSRNINITLSDIKAASARSNYRIHSWYTDELCQQEFTQTHGYSQNLDLYATWDESHAVNIPSFDHGSATAKPAGAATGQPAIAGETVTITPTPDDGWATGDITLTALDAGGQALDPQPTGWPKVIGRTTAPKTFVVPDLPYAGTIGVDVQFLAIVTFDINKPQSAKDDSTATSSGSTGPQYFAVNEPQALVANGFAIIGWNFTGWNTKADGSGTSYAAGAQFTTDAPKTLYARWAANTNTKYTVKHWQQPTSGTTDKSKYTQQATENKTGTTWTKTAASAKSYTGFKAETITQVDHIKADGTTVVNVYYNRNSYTITKGSMSGGSVSVAGSALFGAEVTITISPSAGYELSSISVTGASLSGSGNTRKFTMPAQNVTVSATFAAKTYSISKMVTTRGGDISVATSAKYGSTVTITISPSANYSLDTISATDSTVSGSGNTRTFTMPARNVTVEAAFAIDLATITSDFTIPNGAIVKGELGQNVQISIDSGASITLKGMNIGMNADGSHKWGDGNYAGLTCLGDATINLADGTVNKIMSIGGGNAGIHIKTGTLVIQGSGTLLAYSHDGGAGIGCGYDPNRTGGNIWIKGGTIDARGGVLGAGIGSGGRSIIGDITITGGTITAVGGGGAAGIGCGESNKSGSSCPYASTCGTISISGATVTATKGSGADHSIGKGKKSSEATCGNLYINGTLSAYISDSPYTINP